MMGKILAGAIVIAAIVAGASVYYLQVYGYYDTVQVSGTDDVQLTSLVSGAPEPVFYDSFQAIDADSSPIRYRACFTTSMSQAMLSETYEIYDRPEPLVAPGWFDCFDAQAIGTALENETAMAFLGTKDIHYGIDRVVAILPDGRGFVWHQINRCGKIVFDGDHPPEDCPPPPDRG